MYGILFALKINIKFVLKNTKILFQKMGKRVKGRNITITNSPVQTIHEISLEYDFSDQQFENVQCNTSSIMPIFVATCEI